MPEWLLAGLTSIRYLDSSLNMKMQVVFEALSDPTRRKILELLKKKDRTVGELAEHFNMSGASLSHHLNKLKSSDLVLTERQGQSIVYSIHTTVFEDVAKEAFEFFKLGDANAKVRKK